MHVFNESCYLDFKRCLIMIWFTEFFFVSALYVFGNLSAEISCVFRVLPLYSPIKSVQALSRSNTPNRNIFATKFCDSIMQFRHHRNDDESSLTMLKHFTTKLSVGRFSKYISEARNVLLRKKSQEMMQKLCASDLTSAEMSAAIA